jgi:hypothetical protein
MDKVKPVIVGMFILIFGTSHSHKIHFQKKMFCAVYYDYVRSKNSIPISDPDHLLLAELANTSAASWRFSSAKAHGISCYLMQISFDDTQLTLAQALQGVHDFYLIFQTLPSDGMAIYTIGSQGFLYPVTVYCEP